MITDKELELILKLLAKDKTIVLSYQKSKNILHIKEMTMDKIELPSRLDNEA